MDPLPLRDCLSITGVDSPGRTMAVGGDGQLIFKKSSSELYYYDVQELSTSILTFSRKDPLFDDCQIYDLAFVRSGSLLICLQRPSTGDFFICEGTIDTQEKTVDISGSVHRTKIVAAKGKNVVLIHDEAGVVLISYPIRWLLSGNTVELFHASNYLNLSSGDKYTISLQAKDDCDATFATPFISRNHLYLFYGHDYFKFLLVPLSGTSCGKCQVRTTQGVPPSNAYMNKTVQCFEEFVLVYANQNVRHIRPNFYMLNLTNLKWYPLNLMLSHHFPNGKISFQKESEETVYLHGDCNISGCVEKTHLYQINIEALTELILSRSRTQSMSASSCPSNASISLNPHIYKQKVNESSTLPQNDTPPSTPTTTSLSTSCNLAISPTIRSVPPVVHRFQKKQSREDGKRRYSNGASKGLASSFNSLSSQDAVYEKQSLKRSPSVSSVHWCADMVEQSPLSLQEQLKLAEDMGFPQDVVIAAVNMQKKDVDGMYQPFESTNAMLDILNQASGRSETPKMKLSVYNEGDKSEHSSSYRPITGRSSSVSRSSSFHMGCPRIPRSESQDLSRLMQTFEKERERDKVEVESQFAILKTKIDVLERDKELLVRKERQMHEEVNLLKKSAESHVKDLQELQGQNDHLKQELSQAIGMCDKLTLDNLRKQNEVKDQKELAEHRKKTHEEDMTKKDEEVRALKEHCKFLEDELREKRALLTEQNEKIQEMEEKHSRLQPEELLEKITSVYNIQRIEEEKWRKTAEANNQKLARYYKELFDSYPKMDEERRKVEQEKERAQEENEELRRKYQRLIEKTISECCICLSTKPSVVFLPCRHMNVCQDCHRDPPMRECPTCRASIADYIKVFS